MPPMCSARESTGEAQRWGFWAPAMVIEGRPLFRRRPAAGDVRLLLDRVAVDGDADSTSIDDAKGPRVCDLAEQRDPLIRVLR